MQMQVFQKGSPMAKDFSEAILTLAENGTLKKLEKDWLTPSNECSNDSNSPETEKLTLNNFWGLYGICAATSTICLVLALLTNYHRNHYHHQEADQLQGNETTDDNSVWNKAFRISTELYNGGFKTLHRAATFGGTQGVHLRNSSRWESVSTSDYVGNPQRSQSAVIEML